MEMSFVFIFTSITKKLVKFILGSHDYQQPTVYICLS